MSDSTGALKVGLVGDEFRVVALHAAVSSTVPQRIACMLLVNITARFSAFGVSHGIMTTLVDSIQVRNAVSSYPLWVCTMVMVLPRSVVARLNPSVYFGSPVA
ncbi:MAG: hypothetical protein HKN81_03295 [Gammaproteobacteria bacterium]|nr:hypothetical protein [Gammaproteobacteria bacterium]